MRRYLLSPRAQADLEGIWDYSAERWGVDQAETYTRQIQTMVERLAADPRRGRACDDIREGYRKIAVGSHVIFFRARPDATEIVRILHRGMDVTRHL